MGKRKGALNSELTNPQGYRHMRGALTTLIVLASFMICGCMADKKWKSYNHNSTPQFKQDSAACKIEAKRAYHESEGNPYYQGSRGTVTTEHEGYYDADTGEYQGTSTKRYEKDPIADLADHVAKSNDEKDAYELCMQSKGYYETKEPTSKSRKIDKKNSSKNDPHKKNILSLKCKDTFDCPKGEVCDDNSCIKKCDNNDTNKNNELSETNNEQKCTDTFDCQKGFHCFENKCTNNITKNKMIEEQLIKLKSMYDNGLISTKEYEQKKLDALNIL